jgi:hypothetical protein
MIGTIIYSHFIRTRIKDENNPRRGNESLPRVLYDANFIIHDLYAGKKYINSGRKTILLAPSNANI